MCKCRELFSRKKISFIIIHLSGKTATSNSADKNILRKKFRWVSAVVWKNNNNKKQLTERHSENNKQNKSHHRPLPPTGLLISRKKFCWVVWKKTQQLTETSESDVLKIINKNKSQRSNSIDFFPTKKMLWHWLEKWNCFKIFMFGCVGILDQRLNGFWDKPLGFVNCKEFVMERLQELNVRWELVSLKLIWQFSRFSSCLIDARFEFDTFVRHF